MFDGNWELINGDDAHAIEVLNQSNVINIIEAILRFFQHHDKTDGPGCALCPEELVLRELHRTGTLLLLQHPGSYRISDVIVKKRDGTIYEPPPTADVERHMAEFAAALKAMWGELNAITIAAFALWRINWVHPFQNGNGRTARAFAYTCVCMKYGLMLPGTRTLIDLITHNREQYEDVLAHADKTFAETGTPDLGPMEAYVDRLLRVQLESVPREEPPGPVA